MTEEKGIGLTFDDITLLPNISYVRSRKDPDISTFLGKALNPEIPIINSPMDSVISDEMAQVLWECGSIPIFDRQYDINKLYDRKDYLFFISIGINIDFAIIDKLMNNVNFIGINIDVANGHSIVALETVEKIRKQYPVEIMAGAICTREGYERLVSAGATSIRVGIGNGASCKTRLVTGHGAAQLSALMDVEKAAKELNVPYISDGGCRNSGDAVKALAVGASAIMMGRLLAQTNESGAEKRTIYGLDNDYTECHYRGQASEEYQNDHYGSVKIVPEGEAEWLPILGTARSVISNLCGGIKTGMAYTGAMNLKELKEKSRYMRVTSNFLEESRARIKS